MSDAYSDALANAESATQFEKELRDYVEKFLSEQNPVKQERQISRIFELIEGLVALKINDDNFKLNDSDKKNILATISVTAQYNDVEPTISQLHDVMREIASPPAPTKPQPRPFSPKDIKRSETINSVRRLYGDLESKIVAYLHASAIEIQRIRQDGVLCCAEAIVQTLTNNNSLKLTEDERNTLRAALHRGAKINASTAIRFMKPVIDTISTNHGANPDINGMAR